MSQASFSLSYNGIPHFRPGNQNPGHVPCRSFRTPPAPVAPKDVPGQSRRSPAASRQAPSRLIIRCSLHRFRVRRIIEAKGGGDSDCQVVGLNSAVHHLEGGTQQSIFPAQFSEGGFVRPGDGVLRDGGFGNDSEFPRYIFDDPEDQIRVFARGTPPSPPKPPEGFRSRRDRDRFLYCAIPHNIAQVSADGMAGVHRKQFPFDVGRKVLHIGDTLDGWDGSLLPEHQQPIHKGLHRHFQSIGSLCSGTIRSTAASGKPIRNPPPDTLPPSSHW